MIPALYYCIVKTTCLAGGSKEAFANESFFVDFQSSQYQQLIAAEQTTGLAGSHD